jgi:hypothetical protein
VSFWNLLTRGGTVFLETFSTADQKYRPDFNPAYLLNPNDLPIVFRGLDVLYDKETDDGKRVYVTVIARNG